MDNYQPKFRKSLSKEIIAVSVSFVLLIGTILHHIISLYESRNKAVSEVFSTEKTINLLESNNQTQVVCSLSVERRNTTYPPKPPKKYPYDKETIIFHNDICREVRQHNIILFKGNGGPSLNVYAGYENFPLNKFDCSEVPSFPISRSFEDIGGHSLFKNGPFFRIHKSFILNISYVNGIPRPRSLNVDTSRDKEIPLIGGRCIRLARDRVCEYEVFYRKIILEYYGSKNYNYSLFRKIAAEECSKQNSQGNID